jgi:hypothetical protein
MPRSARALFLLLVIGSALAGAAEPPRPAPRPVPDYDGREEPPETTGEKLLWVPRVALYPAYLATEYLFRWPINSFGRYAEKNKLPTQIVNFFSFGEERQFLLYPTALVDFGFRPSVGLHFVGRRFPWPTHQVGVDAAFGGSRYFALGVKDRIQLDTHSQLTTKVKWDQRPDLIFHGVGWNTLDTDLSRFQLRRTEVSVGYRNQVPQRGWYRFDLGIRSADFQDGSCCGDPGIESKISAGVFPAPEGFRSGYTSFRQVGEIGWGDKASRPEELLGVRANLLLEHAFSLRGGFRSGWLHYGGSLTGFVAFNRRYRVLSLTVDGRFVRPTAGSTSTVPFTELVRLGGNRPMQGFREARLLDESALAATLEYRWPVWTFLDGFLNFEVGNVFGRDLAGFRFDRLRKSFGLGLKAPTEGEETFSLTMAFGSKPFDQGGTFNEFRFLVGLTRAF